MSLPCCWPPSDTPPETPLSVDAGPDESVDTDTPLTLAGSAAGGTPAYTFAWTQLSGPGTATFDDDTDPTTDVSFDVGGDYVLQLTATDADGSIAGDVVTETAVAPVFFLDTLETQPLWAHSLGVQLRTGQTNLFRVRRSSDDAELDITVADLVDIDAALNAFCASGLGYLVKVYNAVAASPYPEITAPSVAEQALVYSADDGGAIFGATNFLAARCYDITPNYYQRADALGLLGDVAVTLVSDFHALSELDEVYVLCAMLTVGTLTDASVRSAVACFAEVTGLNPGTNYSEIDYDQTTFKYANPSQDFAPNFNGWMQADRGVGDSTAQAFVATNGVHVHPSGGPVGVLSTSIVNTFFTWGAYSDGTFAIGSLEGSGNVPTLASNAFAWAVQLSPADQAALDAWELAHHA